MLTTTFPTTSGRTESVVQALRIYPGKNRAHDEPYILPLPAELAAWIEAWIRYTGRAISETGQPFWPSRMPVAGRPVKRIGTTGLYCAIAGRPGSNGAGNSLPLLPRGEGASEILCMHDLKKEWSCPLRRSRTS